jgi:hypothetical protein
MGRDIHKLDVDAAVGAGVVSAADDAGLSVAVSSLIP